MKTFLSFLLILTSSFYLNAQCDGCNDDGSITFDGDNVFSTTSAQAYFWEVCEGTASIAGSNTGSSVTIDCGSDGFSTLKVTRFVEGECIESCVEFECVSGTCNPPPPPPCNCNAVTDDCVVLSVEGTPYVCETLFATLKSHCLPDCYESIDWRVRLGGIDVTFTNQPAYLTWGLPSTGYFNHNVVVTATIHLDNGLTCEATSQITLTCSKKSGDGGSGGGTNLIDSNNPNVTVYPNPVEKGETIQVDWKSIEGAESVEIIDLNGKVLQILPKNENSLQLNSTFNTGIYFIRITKDEKVTRVKFVVK